MLCSLKNRACVIQHIEGCRDQRWTTCLMNYKGAHLNPFKTVRPRFLDTVIRVSNQKEYLNIRVCSDTQALFFPGPLAIGKHDHTEKARMKVTDGKNSTNFTEDITSSNNDCLRHYVEAPSRIVGSRLLIKVNKFYRIPPRKYLRHEGPSMEDVRKNLPFLTSSLTRPGMSDITDNSPPSGRPHLAIYLQFQPKLCIYAQWTLSQ